MGTVSAEAGTDVKMDQSPHRAAGRSDTHRAEAFSDSVFSIIITLLVLDLRPPKHEPGRILYGLLQQWPTYLSYVTSYLYVGVVWLNHKAAFRRIRWINRGLHWLNIGVLFTTALLPFATAVMADAVQQGNPDDERTAVGLYAMIGALLCASWWAFFDYLGRHPGLVREDVASGFFPGERTRALIGVALYAAAGVLGYVVAPSISLAVYLALPIFYGITGEGLYAMPTMVRRPRP